MMPLLYRSMQFKYWLDTAKLEFLQITTNLRVHVDLCTAMSSVWNNIMGWISDVFDGRGGGIKYTENTFSQIKATYNPSYIILVACNLTPKLDLDDHS